MHRPFSFLVPWVEWGQFEGVWEWKGFENEEKQWPLSWQRKCWFESGTFKPCMANVKVVRLYFQFLLSGSHCALSDSQDVSVPVFASVSVGLGLSWVCACVKTCTPRCVKMLCVCMCAHVFGWLLSGKWMWQESEATDLSVNHDMIPCLWGFIQKQNQRPKSQKSLVNTGKDDLEGN